MKLSLILVDKISKDREDYEGKFTIEDIIDRNKLLVSLDGSADYNTITGTLTEGSLGPIAVENRLRFDEAQFNIENTIPPGTKVSTRYRLDEADKINGIPFTDTITIGENKIFNSEKVIDT